MTIRQRVWLRVWFSRISGWRWFFGRPRSRSRWNNPSSLRWSWSVRLNIFSDFSCNVSDFQPFSRHFRSWPTRTDKAADGVGWKTTPRDDFGVSCNSTYRFGLAWHTTPELPSICDLTSNIFVNTWQWLWEVTKRSYRNVHFCCFLWSCSFHGHSLRSIEFNRWYHLTIRNSGSLFYMSCFVMLKVFFTPSHLFVRVVFGTNGIRSFRAHRLRTMTYRFWVVTWLGASTFEP